MVSCSLVKSWKMAIRSSVLTPEFFNTSSFAFTVLFHTLLTRLTKIQQYLQVPEESNDTTHCTIKSSRHDTDGGTVTSAIQPKNETNDIPIFCDILT
jgi:hypothetical protein